MHHLPFTSYQLLLVAVVFVAGCDRGDEQAADAKPATRLTVPGVVQLSPEEIAAAGIVVEPAKRGEFRMYRDFPGTVKPNEHVSAEIASLVPGRVIEVHAELGEEVKGGDVLAVLYSKELGLAQSAYLIARSKLHVAEQAYERAAFLYKEKAIGLSEFQKREGEKRSLQAEVREGRARLELLGMTKPYIQRLERDGVIRSDLPIKAPFNGRIIFRDVTRGEVVDSTHKLFKVTDLSTVWIVTNIPEKDISFLTHPNQKIELRLSAYPDEVFPGKLTYMGDVLDPETRTLMIRIEAPNPHRRLKPEMFATVRIYSEPQAAAILIPEGAVQHDRGRRFVYVQRDSGTFEPREVRLGGSNDGVVQVMAGLREGEPVVTAGAFLLKTEQTQPTVVE